MQCDSELYQLTVIAAGRKRLRHEKEESEAAKTKVCMNLGHKMDHVLRGLCFGPYVLTLLFGKIHG